MQADIHTLCTSDFYRIMDFICKCTDCNTSDPEYTDSFCISFIRKGNFLFHTFRNSFDSFNGCILVTKPGYEHSVTHCHSIPDECTIIEFRQDFFDQLLLQYDLKISGFFRNDDQHSILLKATPETEFLHWSIISSLFEERYSKMKIDGLVLELADQIIHGILDYQPVKQLQDELKKNHLATIERAKEFLALNYQKDISLSDIASQAYVSPFHFSRIFKTFTAASPHQYLMQLRLKNAELLLKNTDLPIGDISFSSGFNSMQYFVSAFRQKYNQAPSQFRQVRSTLQKSRIS